MGELCNKKSHYFQSCTFDIRHEGFHSYQLSAIKVSQSLSGLEAYRYVDKKCMCKHLLGEHYKETALCSKCVDCKGYEDEFKIENAPINKLGKALSKRRNKLCS